MGRTVLVFGDQLDRRTGALGRAEPGVDRVVMVEYRSKLHERPWHRQKLAYLLSAMRHFAADLEAAGFEVHYRQADTLRAGLDGFRAEDLVTMAPSRWDARGTLRRMGIAQVPNDAYIVGEERFAEWAQGRRALGLEPFYRRVRTAHGWLMDGDEPVGGRWNLDEQNRRPPPKRGGVDPPRPYRPREDDIDAQVRADVARYERDLGLELYGEDNPRLFPATRHEALRSLRSFLDRRLAGFGPLEDAVVADQPFLWHSLLSAPLNLGLLHPAEVCEAVDLHYRTHAEGTSAPPLNSYEGFLRQVCGWREYVWGLYWLRMPDWRDDNALGQHGDLPRFYWDGETDMRCLSSTLADLRARAWVHHIPRLMILGNYGLIAGVSPQRLTDWFHGMFVDGYDWVMVPNVIGMSQWADGGVMATKPYAASANYINRMTDYCGDCRYDPRTRGEADSCPFNALYWDFMARNRETLARNRRMAPLLSTLDRFDPQERRAIHDRAAAYRAGS